MALTDDQKYKIVFALCLPGKILSPNSTHYNSVVVSRLNNLPSQVETQANTLVTQIEAMKTELNNFKKDAVRRIDDIELDTTRTRSNKTKELRRLLNELSELLDIPNRCKIGGGGSRCLIL